VIEGMLARSSEFLKSQTPESFMKMVAVASESLRRAKDPGKGGKDTDEEMGLLERFRAIMEPEEVPSG
jgi:hypothetical protein